MCMVCVCVFSFNDFRQIKFSNLRNFQETTAPLKIPIPTPASDRGGPVARIGGYTFLRSGSFCILQLNCINRDLEIMKLAKHLQRALNS